MFNSASPTSPVAEKWYFANTTAQPSVDLKNYAYEELPTESSGRNVPPCHLLHVDTKMIKLLYGIAVVRHLHIRHNTKKTWTQASTCLVKVLPTNTLIYELSVYEK